MRGGRWRLGGLRRGTVGEGCKSAAKEQEHNRVEETGDRREGGGTDTKRRKARSVASITEQGYAQSPENRKDCAKEVM